MEGSYDRKKGENTLMNRNEDFQATETTKCST